MVTKKNMINTDLSTSLFSSIMGQYSFINWIDTIFVEESYSHIFLTYLPISESLKDYMQYWKKYTKQKDLPYDLQWSALREDYTDIIDIPQRLDEDPDSICIIDYLLYILTTTYVFHPKEFYVKYLSVKYVFNKDETPEMNIQNNKIIQYINQAIFCFELFMKQHPLDFHIPSSEKIRDLEPILFSYLNIHSPFYNKIFFIDKDFGYFSKIALDSYKNVFINTVLKNFEKKYRTNDANFPYKRINVKKFLIESFKEAFLTNTYITKDHKRLLRVIIYNSFKENTNNRQSLYSVLSKNIDKISCIVNFCTLLKNYLSISYNPRDMGNRVYIL